MAYSAADREGAFFRGLLGLSATMGQAGAPRVGAPGPGFGAGLLGFSQGADSYLNQQATKGYRDKQMEMMDSRIAAAASDAATLQRGHGRNAALVRKYPGLENLMDVGPARTEAWVNPDTQANMGGGGGLLQPDGPAPINPYMSQKKSQVMDPTSARGGAGDDTLTTMFDGMPLQTVQMLQGADNKMLAAAAKSYVVNKKKPRYKPVTDVHGKGGWGMQNQYGDTSGYQYPPAAKDQFGPMRQNPDTGAWEQQNLATQRWMPAPKAQSGMRLVSDGQGGFTFETGVTPLMSKKTEANVEKKLMDADAGMVRMNTIMAGWRPEYNTLEGRLGHAWSDAKEKYFGQTLPPEERAGLEAFSGWQRDAIEDINLYIKEITGAQMSNTEAGRIRLAKADPGEGIFPKDGPTAFKAKMESAYRALEKVKARYAYYMEKGVNVSGEEIAKLAPISSLRVFTNEETGERVMGIDGKWVKL